MKKEIKIVGKIVFEDNYSSPVETCTICGCESEFEYCCESCFLQGQNESELNALENQSPEQ